MTAFSSLPLSCALLDGIAAQGFDDMTTVQAQSLPPMLAGRDVIVQAATGSGKTAAFGLALLQGLMVDAGTWQMLVLCPTRELADQVSQSIRALAVNVANVKLLTLCGGTPIRTQLSSLAHAPHIVVGTPGRVRAHLERKSLNNRHLRTLVLDEADRMLDMGFSEDIDAIAANLPNARQTLLFSATWPDTIREASSRLQRQPVEITVMDARERPSIEQRFYRVNASDKPAALAAFLGAGEHGGEDAKYTQALVFCNTRAEVDRRTADLNRRGFSALALHGDREQRDRDEVLLRFVNRSCNVLVATDVASRGLDIAALPRVFSYDLAHDADTHTHRIGRTGRAGASGVAITLCAPDEADRALRITEALRQPLDWLSVACAGEASPAPAPMITLVVDGGRKDKLRPGDILGALTGDAGLAADSIGKIDTHPTRTYVAIKRGDARQALLRLSEGRIKGRRFRVRELCGS